MPLVHIEMYSSSIQRLHLNTTAKLYHTFITTLKRRVDPPRGGGRYGRVQSQAYMPQVQAHPGAQAHRQLDHGGVRGLVSLLRPARAHERVPVWRLPHIPAFPVDQGIPYLPNLRPRAQPSAHPPGQKGLPVNCLRPEEIRRLLGAARSLKALVMFRILLATGIRTSECASLDVDDVDYERRLLWILDSKKHRRTTVPVDRSTLELIRLFVGQRRSGPLFISQGTRKKITFQAVICCVRAAGERAGIDIGRAVTPRTLRHTFAVMWDDKHGSIRGLQRILRHKHLSSTQLYLDSDGRAAAREYRRLFDVGAVPPAKPEKRPPLLPYVS